MGLIQKWLEDYLPKKDRCWKKQNTLEVNNHTVNLDDMQGSFFVLLIGNKINNSNLQSILFLIIYRFLYCPAGNFGWKSVEANNDEQKK